MAVVTITYCECKNNSVLLNKTNSKADSITYADKLYSYKQTSANILKYMINQILF